MRTPRRLILRHFNSFLLWPERSVSRDSPLTIFVGAILLGRRLRLNREPTNFKVGPHGPISVGFSIVSPTWPYLPVTVNFQPRHRPTSSARAAPGGCSSGWARRPVRARRKSCPCTGFAVASDRLGAVCCGRCRSPQPGAGREARPWPGSDQERAGCPSATAAGRRSEGRPV